MNRLPARLLSVMQPAPPDVVHDALRDAMGACWVTDDAQTRHRRLPDSFFIIENTINSRSCKEPGMQKNSPEPDDGPLGPSYEGRVLARPEDEVVDQGAGFDAATLVSRRRVLTFIGAGIGAATLAACGAGGGSSSSSTATGASSGTSDGEIPQETNGPYPADGTADLNVLEDSGIVRSDITSSLDGGDAVDGVPLALTFTVVDMANDDAPFEGAAVYAWQCDAQGRYSMYTSGVEDQTWLRGVQAADENGELTFKTIVPGCYQGRWTHIHFEVYPDVDSATDVANAIATSQLAFPAQMLGEVYALGTYSGSAQNLAGVGSDISDDNIFADGSDLQVPTITGDANSGFIASLTVNVDTTTEPAAGGMGGGPAGGEPPSGGGGPEGGGEPPSGAPSQSSANSA